MQALLFSKSKFRDMFEEIGIVRNETDETSLQILSLFRESISEIRLKEGEAASAYFSSDYSTYLIVHTPIKVQNPQKRKEWNMRYFRDLGVSVVELVREDSGLAYVRGLMAINGSKVYAILPFTALDAEKTKKARYPDEGMGHVRENVLPPVLSEIKGEQILDVGCGFGNLTVELAKRNPNSKVFGIDLYDSLTHQAQMNAKALGVSNVEFRTGTVYTLPFETELIDSVTCFLMLHHLDDLKTALLEIRRVLKPEGQLTAIEPLEEQHHHGPQLSEAAWKELFEASGFDVEAKSSTGAVVLKAKKAV